ncbi:hypothetical protein [Methanobrevibacter sp.]|uniref:hypothetical protein n=1 Tax=Methanobrevibacter sp. TaxID=66852 RepID=UPI0038668F08
MEFILNRKKYSIQNHELYINYLMVDNYFRHHYSKYDYDIEFDFITPILSKDKVEFEDILEGTKDLEELIEKEQISFIAPGLRIDETSGNNFNITYQDLKFENIHVGEAIPLLIALNTLLNYKPIVPLMQIKEELDNFIEKFRSYNQEHDI